MLANKVLEWAEKHKNDDWFEDEKRRLQNKQIEICKKLEDPTLSHASRKRYEKQYSDICDIQHMIRIMEHQRLVLFYKSKI